MGSPGLLVEAYSYYGESSSENGEKENSNPNLSIESSSENEEKENSNLNAGIHGVSCDSPIMPKLLYCKARGMPLDHIGTNAVLYFHNGAEGVHGAELKCSHPTCAKKGIKFRYCKYCGKAVAKRNFRKRHAHPELMKKESNLQPPSMTPVRDRNISQDTTPLFKNKSNLSRRISRECGLSNKTGRPKNAMESDNESVRDHLKTPLSSCIELSINNDVRSHSGPSERVPLEWIGLYHDRPTSGDTNHQQKWLQRVMELVAIEPTEDEKSILDEQATTPNSVQAVREEFSMNFPPRCISCNERTQDEDGTIRYRQYAESLSLHINTDLDLLGTNAISLDSNGSIIISCTPKHEIVLANDESTEYISRNSLMF